MSDINDVIAELKRLKFRAVTKIEEYKNKKQVLEKEGNRTYYQMVSLSEVNRFLDFTDTLVNLYSEMNKNIELLGPIQTGIMDEDDSEAVIKQVIANVPAPKPKEPSKKSVVIGFLKKYPNAQTREIAKRFKVNVRYVNEIKRALEEEGAKN